MKSLNTVSLILAALTAVMMLISVYMVIFYAPLEANMGWPQKIFYFHVPIAVICYVGFFITFAGSIGFLMTKNLAWDRYAVSGAEIGVLFATLMLITGMMWGKPIWGYYWTWDPRLTTSLVLWLIFVGYLILRGQVADEMYRARYAAVVGIIGYADVPLVHWSVKLWSRGIHPPKPGLHPDMKTALMVCFVTFALLFAVVFIQRLRYENLKAAVGALKTSRG